MKPPIPWVPPIIPSDRAGDIENKPLFLAIAIVMTIAIVGIVYYICERKA